MLRGDRGGAHDHLGAVRLEHVALVLADLVGADEDAVVALLLRHHRQPDAGVAGRRLHDRAARLQLAGGLGGLDHPGRDPVLHRAAGVEVLDLRQHQRPLALPSSGGSRARRSRSRGVLTDQVQQGVDVLHPANLGPRSRSPGIRRERHGPARRVVVVGKAAAARKLAAAAAYGGGGLSVLGGSLYGVLRLEAALARKAIGEPRADPAARRHRLVRPRPARAGDQGRAARRLRAPPATASTGSRRRPGAHLAQRPRVAGRPAGAPPGVRRGRRAVRGTWPARSTGRCPPTPTSPCVLIGVNDITHSVHAGHVGAQPRRGGPPAAGRRTSRCWSAPAPTSARSGRSRRRSSRSAGPGRAGSPPPSRSRSSSRAAAPSRSAPSSARVRRRPGGAVRPGPLPPVGRGLPGPGRRAAAVGAGRARPRPRRGRSGPRSAAARGCGRSPRPRSRPPTRPAPSSTAPRSAARGAAYAASGSSCGTAAATRPPTQKPRPPTAGRCRRAETGASRGLISPG